MKTELARVDMVFVADKAVAENVVVAEENRQKMVFEFFKSDVQFLPRVIEYSFATKELSFIPEAGQLQSNDAVVAVISVVE
jgi:hypothetical protein